MSGVPPYAEVQLRSRGGNFDWRIFGSGIPFKISGKNTDYVRKWVGWSFGVLVVQAKANPGTNVVCIYDGFQTETAEKAWGSI